MQVALRRLVPVGLVRWRGAAGSTGGPKYTVVVKATFDANDGSRPAALSADQTPLFVGELDPRGLVLEWSDFVRTKAACDVVLMTTTTSSARPVRVRVAHIEVTLDPPMSAISGDGSCAPPAQRMVIPTLPLPILMEHPGRRSIAVIPAPAPTAAILPRRAQRATPILLRPDTILVHPWQPRVSVVYRGSFQHLGDLDEEVTLLVDADGKMSMTPQKEMRGWTQKDAVEPAEDDVDFDALLDAAPTSLVPQSTLEMDVPPLALAMEPPASYVVSGPVDAPVEELQPQPTLDMPVPQNTMTMDAISEGALQPMPTMEMEAVSQPPAYVAPSLPTAPTFGAYPPAAPYASGPASVVPPAPTFGPHPLEVARRQKDERTLPVVEPVEPPPPFESPSAPPKDDPGSK